MRMVEFLGFAKGNGAVDIRIGQDGFELQFAVNFNLGGLIFKAEGGCEKARAMIQGLEAFASRLYPFET